MEFPVKSPVMRRYYAKNETCPECGGCLDTGWECTVCGYDAQFEAYTENMREFDEMEQNRVK